MKPQLQFRTRSEREREDALIRNYRQIGIRAIAAAACLRAPRHAPGAANANRNRTQAERD